MSERQTHQTQPQTTKSSLEGVVASNSGCDIAPVFKRVYDEELKKNVVKKVDELNLFEFIQASASSTDLATLEQRFIALGEIPSADPTLGSNDTTLFPQDIHSLYKMVNDVDGSFKSLPAGIQELFGNKENYLQALLDGTYAQKLMTYASAVTAHVTPAETPSEGDTNE